MNYILIANVKDKIIENKYLEQFKEFVCMEEGISV